MDPEVSFGAWVTSRRKTLDLTREELARCVGCSVSALRKIEGDERRPSRQMAELLAGCRDSPPDQRPTFLEVARGQLRVERLGGVVPPTATQRVPGDERPRPAHHLPTPPTLMIGREPELAADWTERLSEGTPDLQPAQAIRLDIGDDQQHVGVEFQVLGRVGPAW